MTRLRQEARTPQDLTLLERATDPVLNQLSPGINAVLGVAAGMAEQLTRSTVESVHKMGRGALNIVRRKRPDSFEL